MTSDDDEAAAAHRDRFGVAASDEAGADGGGPASSAVEEEDEEEERRRRRSPTTTAGLPASPSPAASVASSSSSSPPPALSPTIVGEGAIDEIPRLVLRAKLNKMRHLVMERCVNPDYLDSIFPELLGLFDPQTVAYNGGIANVKEWKISCYLEVMDGGVPTADPNLELLKVFRPLLDECDKLFWAWHRQQRSCNSTRRGGRDGRGVEEGKKEVKRLMTFVTRYTPAPGEQALLKHVDGAGKVDGSVVVALPIDRWSKPESENTFEGHGGGLTFWDGRRRNVGGKGGGGGPREINYDTRSGDVAFIDRAVWHQANPITRGTRWALVIFYEVKSSTTSSSSSS